MKSLKKLAGIALLALSIPSVAMAQDAVVKDANPKAEIMQVKEDAKKFQLDLSGSASIGLTNMYLCTIGYPIFNNSATQAQVRLNLAKDIALKSDSLSFFTWGNYGSGGRSKNAPHEVDWEVDYAFAPVSMLKGKVVASLGYAQWHYPQKMLGEFADKIAIFTASYSGLINGSLLYEQRVNDTLFKEHLAKVGFSKTIAVGRGVSFTPSVTLNGASNFFGQDGFVGTNTALTASYAHGPVGLEAYVNRFWNSGAGELFGAKRTNQTQVGVNIVYSWKGRK
jgi:hypothetical protein